jgi:hypothetical protein
MAGESGYADQGVDEVYLRIRDMEAKQRILKNRLTLIGDNLIELKETLLSQNIETKKNIEKLNQSMIRMVSFLESASAEFSKFARKEDVEILVKQAKMFQPMELVTKSDLEKLKKK